VPAGLFGIATDQSTIACAAAKRRKENMRKIIYSLVAVFVVYPCSARAEGPKPDSALVLNETQVEPVPAGDTRKDLSEAKLDEGNKDIQPPAPLDQQTPEKLKIETLTVHFPTCPGPASYWLPMEANGRQVHVTRPERKIAVSGSVHSSDCNVALQAAANEAMSYCHDRSEEVCDFTTSTCQTDGHGKANKLMDFSAKCTQF
jgi:hypothetical protein